MSSDDTTLQIKLSNYYTRFDKGNLSSPFFVRNGYATAPFNIDELADQTKFKLLSEKNAKGHDGITPQIIEDLC